ncbi:unnamed protein product [Camellia sinensis]
MKQNDEERERENLLSQPPHHLQPQQYLQPHDLSPPLPTPFIPLTCSCNTINTTTTQLYNRANFLISYVFQPSDNLTSIASMFGSTTQLIIDVNVMFLLIQPLGRMGKKGLWFGLGIGLGVCGILLVLVCGLFGYRENTWKKRKGEKMIRGGKALDVKFVADMSHCLDKYKVFGIEELRQATDGFDERWVIQGSVYKGCIDGVIYAIKKMKWNACEELKILQKFEG